MRTPNLVIRITLPLIILAFAALFVIFSANMGDWVRTRAGSSLIEVFVAR